MLSASIPTVDRSLDYFDCTSVSNCLLLELQGDHPNLHSMHYRKHGPQCLLLIHLRSKDRNLNNVKLVHDVDYYWKAMDSYLVRWARFAHGQDIQGYSSLSIVQRPRN